jgi:retron-type reverse transcriptase
MKHITEMTLVELLELYQNQKKKFYNYRENVFMINVDEKDEVTRKRHFKEYEELQQDFMNTACFIAEKLLK